MTKAYLPVYTIDIKTEVWNELYVPHDGDIECILMELDNAGDLPYDTSVGNLEWMYSQPNNLIYILDCAVGKAYALEIKNLRKEVY
jgi:hypothetical protein